MSSKVGAMKNIVDSKILYTIKYNRNGMSENKDY